VFLLNVSNQISHPYATTGMIANVPWLLSALNFFLNRILIC
jgi:hypothetical protein